MDESPVLKMIEGYVTEGCLARDVFNMIFSMLSEWELSDVEKIIESHGIRITDDSPVSDLYPVEESESEEDSDMSEDSEPVSEVQDGISAKTDSKSLCELIQDGNEEAKTALCRKFEYLVRKYAKRYLKYIEGKMEIDDLMQSGMIGLLRAARKFDPDRNVKFSTYAVWWIKQCISRTIMDEGNIIRMPVHVLERVTRISRMRSELDAEYVPFDSQVRIIADKLSITPQAAEKLMMLEWRFTKIISLNRILSDNNTMPVQTRVGHEPELVDIVEDRALKSAEDEFLTRELHKTVLDVLKTLPDREFQVIDMRFGISGVNPMTLEEIGRHFHLTRERIRQIEKMALSKLKYPERSGVLKDYR